MGNKALHKKLKNKAYRDGFVRAHLDTGVPFQIRALREQRNWSQEEFGRRMDVPQEQISRLETPGRGVTLKTLKKVASAFDVALVVRFVPFSDLATWATDLTSESLIVPSFDEDAGFAAVGPEARTRAVAKTATVTITRPYGSTTAATYASSYIVVDKLPLLTIDESQFFFLSAPGTQEIPAALKDNLAFAS